MNQIKIEGLDGLMESEMDTLLETIDRIMLENNDSVAGEELEVFKRILLKFKEIEEKDTEKAVKDKETIEAVFSINKPENIVVNQMKIPYAMVTSVNFDFCVGNKKDAVTVVYTYNFHANEDEESIKTKILANALGNYIEKRSVSICMQTDQNIKLSPVFNKFLDGYSEINIENTTEKDDTNKDKTM